MAIDTVGAGISEIVLVVGGSSARQTNLTLNTPVDAVIMAIVDYIDIEGNRVYDKHKGRQGYNASCQGNRKRGRHQKDKRLTGVKLLVIQPITSQGKDKGSPIVAADSIGAGYGETVFYARSRKVQRLCNPNACRCWHYRNS